MAQQEIELMPSNVKENQLQHALNEAANHKRLHMGTFR